MFVVKIRIIFCRMGKTTSRILLSYSLCNLSGDLGEVEGMEGVEARVGGRG